MPNLSTWICRFFRRNVKIKCDLMPIYSVFKYKSMFDLSNMQLYKKLCDWIKIFDAYCNSFYLFFYKTWQKPLKICYQSECGWMIVPCRECGLYCKQIKWERTSHSHRRVLFIISVWWIEIYFYFVLLFPFDVRNGNSNLSSFFLKYAIGKLIFQKMCYMRGKQLSYKIFENKRVD